MPLPASSGTNSLRICCSPYQLSSLPGIMCISTMRTGGRPEFVAVDDAFQPFRLLPAVFVPVAHAVIAGIVVGLVFTAVEDDEEGRAAAERVVGFAGRRGEIVEPVLCISAAVLVVAARHDEGDARGCEYLRCRPEAGVPERLLGFGLAGQVAVQADEVRLGFGGLLDQQLENGVAGVDVVDHPEIDLFLCRVEGSDGVGLAPVHFAAVPVVEDDAPGCPRSGRFPVA